MYKVYIDTSSNKEITVGLEINGIKDSVTKQVDAWKAQIVLPLIDELLQKHTIQFSDLQAIEVVSGPGSFTGLRVGVAVANTLGIWLKIPINGKPVGEIVEPIYE